MMNEKKFLHKIITTSTLAFAIIVMAGYYVSAIAQGVNVSYNCDVTQVNAGDEVRLVVSTKEMSICTFIAYVEYDSSLLEYQGFVGGVSGRENSAYLLPVDDSENYSHEVAVEQGETGDVVGMYMVGTTEKKYAAANPLVTLIFKAKNTGSIEETSFVAAESTDGTDGYTSESIKAENKVDGEASQGKSGLLSKIAKNKGSYVIAIIAIAALLVVTAVFLVIKRRKEK